MYSSANNHHGDVHGWFSKPYSNMVASNVSSNHGSHATIALDSVDGGIHEDSWFPVTNTRSYGEQAVHPLVHEADEELSSYKPKFKTIPYKHVPLSAKAMARGKAHCVALILNDQRNMNTNKNKIQWRACRKDIAVQKVSLSVERDLLHAAKTKTTPTIV